MISRIFGFAFPIILRIITPLWNSFKLKITGGIFIAIIGLLFWAGFSLANKPERVSKEQVELKRLQGVLQLERTAHKRREQIIENRTKDLVNERKIRSQLQKQLEISRESSDLFGPIIPWDDPWLRDKRTGKN